MTAEQALSYCAAEVRRHDPERFLAAVFAPAERRESLFALYAFNLEIAKIRELVSEPMLGEIRLQWWRDAIAEIYDGAPRRHAVVAALADAVAGAGLSRGGFDRLIDARALDLADAPPATLERLEGYAADTSSGLLHLSLQVLDADTEASRQAATHVGIAWALTGLVRAMPFHLRAKRIYLPDELVRRHGVVRDDVLELRSSDALRAAVRDLAACASAHLAEARRVRAVVPANALPALLPARLASAHLRRIARAGFDPFAPALAAPLRFPGLRLAWSSLRRQY